MEKSQLYIDDSNNVHYYNPSTKTIIPVPGGDAAVGVVKKSQIYIDSLDTPHAYNPTTKLIIPFPGGGAAVGGVEKSQIYIEGLSAYFYKPSTKAIILLSSVSNTLLTGLVSVWELDEIAGTNTVDAHGSNDGTNHFADINIASITNLGTCYEFLGVEDWVSVPTLHLGNNFSVFAWVNTGSINSDAIITKYDSGTGSRDWRLNTSGGNKVNVIVSDDGTYDATHTKDYTSIGTFTGWAHIGFTFAAGVLKLYINGVEQSATTTLDGPITTINNSATTIEMGRQLNNGASAGLYEGKIDQPGLFNVVKSQADIDAMVNSGDGLAYANWE